MSFRELGLAEPIVRAVLDAGYSVATPIQEQAIPPLLSGRDVLACAPTGTGKTAAFLLPLVQRMASRHSNQRTRAPRALVLTPTRELAAQVHDSARVYGRHARLRSAVVYGGVSQQRQVNALRAGVDLLIATPGRLIDLLNQGHATLSEVDYLVLDEADRMLDMGFVHDVRRIVKQTAGERQTVLFSATLSPDVTKLAGGMLTEPETVRVGPRKDTVATIEQWLYRVNTAFKYPLLQDLVSQAGDSSKILVFSRTKRGAEKLSKKLKGAGVAAAAIHGNKSQAARTRTLSEFRSGAVRLLVASDVAARGIDVSDISHVVNYDVPDDPDTYVHRIGRTGRAGARGIAFTLCGDDKDHKRVRDIERRLRSAIPVASHKHEASTTHRESHGTLRHRPAPQAHGRDDQARTGDGQARRQGTPTDRPDRKASRGQAQARRPQGQARRPDGQARRPEGQPRRRDGQPDRSDSQARRGQAQPRRPVSQARRGPAPARRSDSQAGGGPAQPRRPDGQARRGQAQAGRSDGQARRRDWGRARQDSSSRSKLDSTIELVRAAGPWTWSMARAA